MHQSTRPSLFGREPALIVGAINALIAVAVGFGLQVTPEQVGLINAAVAAILSVIVRAQVTPAAEVAERVHDGEVIAGPANDLIPTGAKVRDLGAALDLEWSEAGDGATAGRHRETTTYGGDSKTDATWHP